MDVTKISNVFKIIFSRLKQSEDSYELFKATVNFSITSKTFHEALNDEILLQICYRYVRGRSRFVKTKLNRLIRSNDITGFSKFGGEFIKIYHHSEYLPTLTKLLPDIIRLTSYEFLHNYMLVLDVIVWRDLQAKRHPLKYSSFFKPVALVKAIKLAYERGCTDMVLLLFDVLTNCYVRGYYPGFRDTSAIIKKIRSAFENKERLNFAKNIGNIIQQAFAKGILLEPQLILPMFLDFKKCLITPELFDLPIEDQPWFFGCYTPEVAIEIHRSLISEPNSMCVAFRNGFKVFRCKNWKLVVKPLQITNTESISQTLKRLVGNTKYYIPNNGVVQQPEVCKFYRSLIAGDIEEMKRIHQSTPIDWKTAVYQYRPYLVNLNSDNPRIEVMQCLHDLGVPIDNNLLCFDDILRTVEDKHIARIQFLLENKGNIWDILPYLMDVTKLLQFRSFMNLYWFQRILESIPDQSKCGSNYPKLLDFLLDTFPQIYRKHKIFSERKLLVLLAHKYGDESSYFKMLPKELIRVIFEFVDEPTVSVQFAEMLLRKHAGLVLNYGNALKRRDIDRLLLITDNYSFYFESKWPASSYSRIRPNYDLMRDALRNIDKMPRRLQFKYGFKLHKFIAKYETDPVIFSNFDKIYNKDGWINWEWECEDLLEIFKTKNEVALQYFLKEHKEKLFRITKDTFDAYIKPLKHKITYEEALVWMQQVLSLLEQRNEIVTNEDKQEK